jgi:hypothetical protein
MVGHIASCMLHQDGPWAVTTEHSQRLLLGKDASFDSEDWAQGPTTITDHGRLRAIGTIMTLFGPVRLLRPEPHYH